MNLLILGLQFLAGFVFLVGGAELLVRGASRLAKRYNVPEVIIGLTVVAFGTSLPELVVSLTAVWHGDTELAVGNVIGSNIANLGLILGICGLIAVLPVAASFVRREVPLLLGVSVVFSVMAVVGHVIGRLDGLLLVAGLGGFIYLSYRAATTEPAFEGEVSAAAAIAVGITQPSRQIWIDLLFIGVGIVGLVLGASWLVAAAEQIAVALGVPELVIGLTLVAVGTSLPEVAASVVAVARGNTDIAIGNVVGSNLFNILGIAGITALVSPLPVPDGMGVDFGVMIGLAVLVLVFVWRRPHAVSRWEAGILLAIYVAYIGYLVFRSVA